ncbi:AMP-binding protein [Streptomonospora sp. S1-112]|uniref:AMP-binding protein n=1 Tax=Streptomonospora mangrovi TaxID=2883123 RepID=A0A9X3NI46_9ACTN|nr:AMP-binding protein [Streptomonospora mangrovi]MDA0564229.1 AMP-binding protein [Streptomonospora mangrovi]
MRSVYSVMQTEPLGLHLVLDRAEALFADRAVLDRGPGGVRRTDYAGVFAGARALAALLADLGLRPGDSVATFSWNTAEHLCAYIALPGSGLVMHTVNIRMGAEETAYTLAHAGDRAVLVDASLWEVWAKVAPPDTLEHVVVTGEAPADLPAAHGGARVHRFALGTPADTGTAPAPAPRPWRRPADEHEPAAICYTSGTTGHPKAVVYSHRSVYLHALTLCGADAFAVSHHDTVLPVVPMFHANAWNLPYAALLAGAGLALPGRHLDPERLGPFISASGATFSAGVPTVWSALAEAVRAGRVPADALAPLERVVIGGSAAPPALLDALAKLGVAPVHAWGMTECSPVGLVATDPLTADEDERAAARRSQGRPLPGLAVRSAAADGEVPWDGATPGELEISGPYVVDRYYRPEKDTEDSFTRTPDGRRWLRTGDMVVVGRRGYVTLVDRAKDMVKSGGEWISSVDVENRLTAHPGVRESAVIAVPDPTWGERPLAVVARAEGAEGGPVAAEDLAAYLAESLPRWQVPDRFVFVDEVPKTGVGKFDKKRMRAVYGAAG